MWLHDHGAMFTERPSIHCCDHFEIEREILLERDADELQLCAEVVQKAPVVTRVSVRSLANTNFYAAIGELASKKGKSVNVMERCCCCCSCCCCCCLLFFTSVCISTFLWKSILISIVVFSRRSSHTVCSFVRDSWIEMCVNACACLIVAHLAILRREPKRLTQWRGADRPAVCQNEDLQQHDCNQYRQYLVLCWGSAWCPSIIAYSVLYLAWLFVPNAARRHLSERGSTS